MEERIGRFISPDPVGHVHLRTGKINEKTLLNPQGINTYAYALNNPYRFLDALGLIWVTIESNTKGHHKHNTLRRILGFATRWIGRGGDPAVPFADPAEHIGVKRNLIQEWQHDQEHPERDKEYPFRTRRIVEQTFQQDHNTRDLLRSDPDGDVYDWFPRVPDKTYKEYPNTKYDYNYVDPRDKRYYWKADTPPAGSHSIRFDREPTK